uniref:Uncharacterized protein LOC114325336 isoform X2 n=1 Tax=Diabrotica virgifera virgifera TaxID=50390 RepID=A0A6P7F6X9_DIAVI
MGSSFLVFERYLYQTINPPPPNYPTCPPPIGPHSEEVHCKINNSDHLDGLNDDDLPSLRNFILYSVVITIISCFGIVGNIMSLAVLRRKELVGSVYTYLSDRCVYLWNPAHCTKPKFCNPKLARILMSISAGFSVILNTPYCFIFTVNPDGTMGLSKFIHSSLYACYNWVLLVIFTITPGTILIIGNSFLIRTLQKARKVKCNGRKRQDHRNLTITLIIIIVLFIIVEVPSNFLSRTRAVTLIFFGANVGLDEMVIEIVREICTLLGAVNVTANFLLYYLFCPAFCRALKETFRYSIYN